MNSGQDGFCRKRLREIHAASGESRAPLGKGTPQLNAAG